MRAADGGVVARQELGDGAPDGVHHVVVHPPRGWVLLATVADLGVPLDDRGAGGRWGDKGGDFG